MVKSDLIVSDEMGLISIEVVEKILCSGYLRCILSRYATGL